MELCAFHCAEKLRYWRSKKWKFFTRLLYQKSPLLRTGKGNCLQKGFELVMSIIEIMDFKSATYVLDARCKRINDYMLISRAIISSSIFAISENPKSDG